MARNRQAPAGTTPMTDRQLAVVCVSGGMDSAVTAALAAREHRLAFLHANYGQRTEAKELACFHALADHFGAGLRLVVDFSDLRQIGGSSLTDAAIPVREGEPVDGVVPSSYVPFRNAHLLAAAVSWGEVIGARAIFVGRGLGGLLGLPGLPSRVLPGFRGGGAPRDPAGDVAAHRHAGDLDDEGRDRPTGARPGGPVREDLVLLPGGGNGLRGLRVLPAEAPRLPGGGGSRPHFLSHPRVRH